MQLFFLGDWGILILRIALGIIFLIHGKQKWNMWKMRPSEQMSGQMLNLMKFLSIIEPLGGLAVILGYFTQTAAAILGIIMIGAILFKIKTGTPFTASDKMGWEFDLILLAAAIFIFISGAGQFGLDRIF